MKFNKTIVLAILTSIFLCFSSIGFADDNMTETKASTAPQKPSYGQKIGEKALWGLTNATLGLFEIPKNIIIVNNDTNFFYAMTGGLGLGIMNTVGRTVVGITDLAFFLLPTKPVVYPVHPWNHYLDANTSYHKLFDADF